MNKHVIGTAIDDFEKEIKKDVATSAINVMKRVYMQFVYNQTLKEPHSVETLMQWMAEDFKEWAEAKKVVIDLD
jgi:hypothetical protein